MLKKVYVMLNVSHYQPNEQNVCAHLVHGPEVVVEVGHAHPGVPMGEGVGGLDDVTAAGQHDA